MELAHQRRWATRAGVRRNLFADIEAYYYRQRIHLALSWLKPDQATAGGCSSSLPRPGPDGRPPVPCGSRRARFPGR
nr:hypothetical protein [Geminicoccus harenae]